MKHISTRILSALVAASCALGASAIIDLEYYGNMQGLTGADLKAAAGKIAYESLTLKNAISTTYTNLRDNFKKTDYITVPGDPTVYWLDMYSDELVPLTTSFSDAGYQREHSLPKSWWKDESFGSSSLEYTRAYCDMFNLYPANGKANNLKSNWPLGEVGSNPLFDNGVTKVGTPKKGIIYGMADDVAAKISRVFEPDDRYKGDFARAYMYVATCYGEELAPHWNPQYLWMVQRNEYPVFTDWAVELLLRWSRADKVSEKEATRCNDVESIQFNRNPFIDFPNLCEYIWGDSIGRPFDIFTTVKSQPFTGATFDPSMPEETILDLPLVNDRGGCTIETKTGGSSVWKNNNYGWVASGFYSSTNHATDASLVTPEINLSAYGSANFAFEHAANKGTTEGLHIYVRDAKGTDHEITDQALWPSGTSWTFITSGTIKINEYVGQKVKLVFRYTSTTANAATWEIKNLTVRARKAAGINTTPVDSDAASDLNAPIEYFSIDGRRIDPANYRGIAIRRQGSRATKIIL